MDNFPITIVIPIFTLFNIIPLCNCAFISYFLKLYTIIKCVTTNIHYRTRYVDILKVYAIIKCTIADILQSFVKNNFLITAITFITAASERYRPLKTRLLGVPQRSQEMDDAYPKLGSYITATCDKVR